MSQISAKSVKELRDKTGAGMMDCKHALSDADGDPERANELLRERGLAKAGKREGRKTTEGVVAIALDSGIAGMVELGCETDFVARTDEFIAMGDALAKLVLSNPGSATVEGLSATSLDGETVADKITAAVAKLGENVVLNRVARLGSEGAGVGGGYVHAGGKLGVIVSLTTSGSGEALDTLAKDVAMHVAAADPSPIAIDRSGVDQAMLESERAIFRTQAVQGGKPEKIIDKIVEGRINKYLSDVCLIDQAYVKDPDRTIGALLSDVGSAAGTEIAISGYQRFKLGEHSNGEAEEA
ncbi:MAG: translation elongation factor Ts [Myxococcota bacterium]